VIGEEIIAVFFAGEDSTKNIQNFTKKFHIPQTNLDTNYDGPVFHQSQNALPSYQVPNHYQPNVSSIPSQANYSSLLYGYNSIQNSQLFMPNQMQSLQPAFGIQQMNIEKEKAVLANKNKTLIEEEKSLSIKDLSQMLGTVLGVKIICKLLIYKFSHKFANLLIFA